MHEELVNEIIAGLQKIYKDKKYFIYDEGDIAFLIRNKIWNELKFKDDYYIFNEFPVKLDYPRWITESVYGKIKDQKVKDLFKEKFATKNWRLNINNGDLNLLIKYYKEKYLDSKDVGVVNVDYSLIPKNDYDNFKNHDMCFAIHECVIEIKFEKGVKGRQDKDICGENYLRRDINTKSSTNNRQNMKKDILGIDSIVEDKKSNSGYFILVCEGSKSISNCFQEYKKGGNYGELQYNVEKSCEYESYRDNGFIYIYKRTTPKECIAWMVPLRDAKI